MTTHDPVFNKRAKIKTVLTGIFLLWTTIILAVFFVYQKPVGISQVVTGLASTAWTILLAFALIFLGASMGYRWLQSLSVDPAEQFLLGAGLGVGALGIAGFVLAATGWAKPGVLLAILVILWLWQLLNGGLSGVWRNFRMILSSFTTVNGQTRWMLLAASIAFFLTFIQSLAPPADGFDSLLYHLTVPAWWLRDGGLRLAEMPPYWFPSLVEGFFVWPMGLGSDTAPQLLHLLFGILTIFLAFSWAHVLWGDRVGWWTLTLILTMPSILWLSTWAYTDLFLSFFILSSLYTLWKWMDTHNPRWLWMMAIFTGFAMGVKYTSFVIPLFAVGFITASAWNKLAKSNPWELARYLFGFGAIAILIASPWYLRNWVWMHNPIYPFVFESPYWDAFRTRLYTAPGTGIGWNLLDILWLPLNVTLGHHEAQNILDGRIGPFFLILFPLLVWSLWKSRHEASASHRNALSIISLFFIVSALFWVYGVINTAGLWQSRLLYPSLIPLAIPMAFAVKRLFTWDTKSLRISFIFSVLVGMFLLTNLLDFGLFIFFRNPLMAAVGAEKRQAYIQRIQPGYESALELSAETPTDAVIYFLYEPRSYGIDRLVYPDSLNDHLAYNLDHYKTAENILTSWQQAGYTHVLLCRCNMDFPPEASRLTAMLRVVDKSKDGNYILFSIPKNGASDG